MGDELHAPSGRSLAMARQVRGVSSLTSAVILFCVMLLAGCGQAGAASPIATQSATATPQSTATPIPSATATSAQASGGCQPDPYSIYAEQTGFVASLTDAPLPAPPQTKHGIGSSGVNGSVSQGGESGMCTIGAFASVTAFYTEHLPSLGWQFSAPPASISACFHDAAPAKVWWKGSATFAWYDGGAAGAGSTFWSYTYCAAQS